MDGNFSPFEIYAAKLHGDDVNHLRELLAGDRLHSDCLPCRRIAKAAALAEFVELDPPERVA
jgi:hypothetical protein